MGMKVVAIKQASGKTGLSNAAAKTVVELLAQTLANSYFLYLKTQNFHWNVVSKNFHSLHLLFESQYQELAEAVDEIAEHIRALGHPAPASFKQFSKLADIEESTHVPNDVQMISELLSDHELICRNLRANIKVAQEVGDESSADLMISRLQAHEKAAWMLRSSLA